MRWATGCGWNCLLPPAASDTIRYTLTAAAADGSFATLTFTIQVLGADGTEPGSGGAPSERRHAGGYCHTGAHRDGRNHASGYCANGHR